MGAGESQQPKPNGEQQEELKINHPRFQSIRLITNKDDEDKIEVKFPVANEREYNQWVLALKDAPADSDQLLLPEKYQFQKEGFCGSSGFVKIVFDNFPYVLADEIRNRSQLKQKYFEESELWYLVYTLISAGHQFHRNGKKVGDVRPENVFINEDGQVKVATHVTWPSENTNYHKTFFEKELTYLAPEQLKDIQYGKPDASCDPKLAESFSVGLTCLDAGNLASSSGLYLKPNKFNYDQLNQRFQDLKSIGYSEVLCLVIENLCEPDSDRRSTCSELYKWLEPYKEYIINLQKFEVSSLPEKLVAFSNQQQSPTRLQGSVQPLLPQNVTYNRSSTTSGYAPQGAGEHQEGLNFQGERVYYQQFQPPIQQFQQIPVQQVPIQQMPIQPGQPVQFAYTRQIPVYPGQTILSQGPLPQASQTVPISGENKTAISTYTYGNYVPSVSQPIPNYQPGQTVQYNVRPGEGAAKSSMELTLEKIDEQLQMSRKMFPS